MRKRADYNLDDLKDKYYELGYEAAAGNAVNGVIAFDDEAINDFLSYIENKRENGEYVNVENEIMAYPYDFLDMGVWDIEVGDKILDDMGIEGFLSDIDDDTVLSDFNEIVNFWVDGYAEYMIETMKDLGYDVE